MAEAEAVVADANGGLNTPMEDEGSLFSKKGKGPAFRRRKKKEEDAGDGTAAANSQTAAHLRIQRCAPLALPLVLD
jgi:hypothetical protein